MKNFTSRAGIGVAVSAAVMSVVCAFYVPYAYPWLSLALAVLACAVGVSAARRFSPPSSMSDVISDVEAESTRPPAAKARTVSQEQSCDAAR